MTTEVSNEQSPVVPAPESPAAAPPQNRLERALSALGAQKPGAPSAPPPEAPPAAPEEDHGVHAKALALAQRKEREAFEAKQESKRLQAELEQAKAAQEARKKMNPLELLKAEHGLDYEGLTRAIVENKFATKTPEQETLSVHEQELQALKAELQAYKQEKLSAQEQEIQEQNIAFIQSQMKASDDYAIIQSLPAQHAKVILDRYTAIWKETGEEPDLNTLLSAYEADAQSDVDALMSSDKVLQRFLAVEANKERVMTLLGITKPTPQQAQQANQGARSTNGRVPLPHTRASDAGTRSVPNRPASSASRLEAAVNAIRK